MSNSKFTDLTRAAMVKAEKKGDLLETVEIQVRQLSMILRSLPDSISERIVQDTKALDQLQQNMEQITAAQRAAIQDLVTEITLRATEAMEAEVDKLIPQISAVSQTLEKMQEQSQAMAGHSSELRKQINGAKYRDGRITPGLKQMISKLGKTVANLDEATEANQTSQWKIAWIAGLVTGLVMLAGIAAMPWIWDPLGFGR